MEMLLSKPEFCCSSFEKPILEWWVLTGKEYELFSGDQPPKENADSCPKKLTLQFVPGLVVFRSLGAANQ